MNAKYLMMVCALLVIATGCEHDIVDTTSKDDPSINIEEPKYGYIFFDSEAATRGTLIAPEKDEDGKIVDDRLKQDFGVIGYTYIANDWTFAEAMTKPNVFGNHPQRVTWNEEDEVHSYAPLQAWLGKQKYAFFAYIPWGLTVSSADYYGNPYIDFTFSRDNLSNQVDVMTADNIHIDYTSRTVDFKMEHRLSAIDVYANNIFENKQVKITSLSIELDNLLYDKVRIPLNTRDKVNMDYYAGVASDKEATYTLLPSGKSITLEEDAMDVPITSTSVSPGTTMIVIPQAQYIDMNGDGDTEDEADNLSLEGVVNVAYQVLNNGTLETTVGSKGYPFTFNRSLISGQRYYIMLNFADGDVTIGIVEPETWIDSEEVKHEFE